MLPRWLFVVAFPEVGEMKETSDWIQQFVTRALRSSPMTIQLPKNVKKIKTFGSKRFICAEICKNYKLAFLTKSKDFDASKKIEIHRKTNSAHHILLFPDAIRVFDTWWVFYSLGKTICETFNLMFSDFTFMFEVPSGLTSFNKTNYFLGRQI